MGAPVQVAVAAVVLLLVTVVLVVTLRSRAASRRALITSRAETELLRQRLEALEERLETTTTSLAETRDAYLITDAGTERAQDRAQPNVPDRVVLSAAFGEPLVKVVAFGHGVARALSPEVRNRIWFEMRREVRRARKQRRRETKEAWRAMRAEERKAA